MLVLWEELKCKFYFRLLLTDVALDVDIHVLSNLSQSLKQFGGTGGGEARGDDWLYQRVLGESVCARKNSYAMPTTLRHLQV